MARLRSLAARLRALFREHAIDHELRQEIADHIAESTDALIRSGVQPAEARRQALRQFGGVTQTEESHREARGFRWITSTLQDVRYAARTLRLSVGYTGATVLTLGLGVGATTAIFGIVSRTLLIPLPYRDVDRIVVIDNGTARGSTVDVTGGDFFDLAREPGLFEAVAYFQGGEMGVQFADHAEFAGARLVHPDFFRVFSVTPLAGRVLNRDDAASPTVVVSAGFADRNFGGPEPAIGQSVFVEDRTYRVVGVMPSTLRFPANTDLWAAGPLAPDNTNRTAHNYRAVGILLPGVSTRLANERLAAFGERLATAFPSNADRVFRATPLRESLVQNSRGTLVVMMAAVMLLLVIACANVANLMLARGESRAREISLRSALGATRARLIRQLLVEGALLGLLASAFGVGVSAVALSWLVRAAPDAISLPGLDGIAMDWRVLVFGACLSVATTLACTLAPVMRLADRRTVDALRGGTRMTSPRRALRVRNGLVVAQIGLSCALAINAGLLFRTLAALTSTPFGFVPSGVLVAYAHAPAGPLRPGESARDSYVRVGRTFDDILARVRARADVIAAGAAMGLPTGQYRSNGLYAVEGQQDFAGDPRKLRSAGFRLASPGYFETIGVPILRGREFADDDVYERPFVAVISASLARQAFGDTDPIGHRIMCGFDQPQQWMTVVGVVGDVRQASPAAEPGPELYMPLRQHPFMANEIQLVVRGPNEPDRLVSPLREAIRSADPRIAVKFTTFDASVAKSIAAPRLRAGVLSAFASFALALALSGVFAVMSYTTSQRTAEFGVRIALGATPLQIGQTVLAGVARLTFSGVAIACVLALASQRVLSSLLFGVSSVDVLTYGVVIGFTALATIAAAAVPALRAARVNPLAALRAE